VQYGVSIVALGRSFPLAEFFLHAGEVLLLLLDLLVEEDVLILQELNLGEEFVHLNRMLLSGVFDSCDGDVLACDEILHVLGGICLLFGGEVVIEVYLFDLGLFLLGPLSFLELLIGGQSAHRLPPRVLLLDLVDQLLELEVAD
jgi:hypothetical protein